MESIKNILGRIFSFRHKETQVITGKIPIEITVSKLEDELHKWSTIDEISDDMIQAKALIEYCILRQYKEKGYFIGAYRTENGDPTGKVVEYRYLSDITTKI